MVGKTFTYLIGSDSSALFFNSKNQDLNAEDVYSKLVTPVFGKGVAYDVPNKVSEFRRYWGEGLGGRGVCDECLVMMYTCRDRQDKEEEILYQCQNVLKLRWKNEFVPLGRCVLWRSQRVSVDISYLFPSTSESYSSLNICIHRKQYTNHREIDCALMKEKNVVCLPSHTATHNKP